MKNWGIHESGGALDSGYLPQTDPGLARFVRSGWPPQHVTGSTFSQHQLGRCEPVMSRDGQALSQAPYELNVMKAPESRSKVQGGCWGCHFESLKSWGSWSLFPRGLGNGAPSGIHRWLDSLKPEFEPYPGHPDLFLNEIYITSRLYHL